MSESLLRKRGSVSDGCRSAPRRGAATLLGEIGHRTGGSVLRLCVLVVALATACGGPRAPASEKPRRVILATEYDDQRVGDEAASAVEAEMGLLDEPRITQLVQEIGKRLVRFAPSRSFEYEFYVVDQEMPNAFALPGGHIYVSRGLIALANSEDELACVIGHEITHSAARHAAAMQAHMRTLNPLSMGYLRAAQLASYSRDQERDADRGGQEMAARAGYDPMGMPDFLRHLDGVERFYTGWSRLPSFFSTHPTTPERTATAVNRAHTIEWTRVPGITKDREGFLKRIEGTTMGVNPAEGVFEGTRFLHPDLGFSIHFPEEWEVVNSRQAVGAYSPVGDAQVVLTMAGRGDDPKRAADLFLEHRGAELGIEVRRALSLTLGDLRAYRIEAVGASRAGRMAGQITWIAFEGLIFQITGLAPARVADRYEGRLRSVARSFRAITEGERDAVEIVRLRLVRAQGGETLGEFLPDTENSIPASLAAVANGMVLDETLAAGQVVKIGVAERYEPAVKEPAGAEVEQPDSVAPNPR